MKFKQLMPYSINGYIMVPLRNGVLPCIAMMRDDMDKIMAEESELFSLARRPCSSFGGLACSSLDNFEVLAECRIVKKSKRNATYRRILEGLLANARTAGIGHCYKNVVMRNVRLGGIEIQAVKKEPTREGAPWTSQIIPYGPITPAQNISINYTITADGITYDAATTTTTGTTA